MLDGLRQRLHCLEGILAVGLEVGPHTERRAEGDEHAPPEGFASLEGQPYRHHRELGEGGLVVAAQPAVLVAESETRRTGLDALHARLRVGRSLGVDGDRATARQRGEGGLEGGGVAIHLVRVVLPAVDGDGTARAEETRQQRIPE